jgi:hypothetical protein
MVDWVVMDEKVFAGGDVNTALGVLEMDNRRSLRGAREQAGSIESIPDDGGKCKDSAVLNRAGLAPARHLSS